MTRRIYLDTEFIAHTLSLISIGAVDDQGRAFFATADGFDEEAEFDDWLWEHVAPSLPPRSERWPNERIADEFIGFVNDDDGVRSYGGPVEFWTWCGGFDYVVVTNLMGGMAAWPTNWPMYFNDIAQLAHDMGIDHPGDLMADKPHDHPAHSAIGDACEVRYLYRKLTGMRGQHWRNTVTTDSGEVILTVDYDGTSVADKTMTLVCHSGREDTEDIPLQLTDDEVVQLHDYLGYVRREMERER